MAQPTMLLKFGWLPLRFGLLAVSFATAAQAQPGRVIFAGGQWAGLDFGARCEARSAALWAKRETRPFAGFAFGQNAGGRFYVHLSRPVRAGASVIATIGSQPFLLAGKGEWAWSRGDGQRQALLKAARYGQSFRVESRDLAGRRIVDRYSLAGAATAIDAAAATCAGKIAAS